MTDCYQLSCGHWQSDPAAYDPGGVYQCLYHGRVLITGRAGVARRTR